MNECTDFGFSHCKSNANCGDIPGYVCVNQQCVAPSQGGSGGGSPPPSGGNSGSPPPTSGGSSSNSNSGTKGTTSSNNSGGSNNGNSNSNSGSNSNSNSNSNSGSNSSGNSNSNSKGTSTATNSISSPNPTNTQNSAPAVSGNPSSTNNDNTENNQGVNDNSGNSNGVSINDFQKALIVTLICAAIVAFLVVYLFVNYQDKIKDKIFGKKKSDTDSAPGSPIPISSQGSQSTPVVTASNINNAPLVDAYNQRQAPDTQPRFQYSPSVGSSIPLYTNSTTISFTGNQTSSIHLQPNGTLPSRNSWNGSQVSQHPSPMLHSIQPVQTPPIQYGELPIMLNNRSSQAVESIPPTLIVPPTGKNNTAQI
ncbi:hypothetical protein HK103_004893 [Boothiomyces macroporosus]|uniref:Uncharacterized protein n=1 Tax=Boothiomyces macroporosus TaxID=261099 RepID=A0AAD5Y3U5_9FUNG|nr:hypothetical protein HK103_004893 [Boothiomyces macroporosus]